MIFSKISDLFRKSMKYFYFIIFFNWLLNAISISIKAQEEQMLHHEAKPKTKEEKAFPISFS
jgi:hypothetical protein